MRVEATGLRNPYGLAFVPGTSRLLVAEHGRDDLGQRTPPEEINLVRTGGPARWYGFRSAGAKAERRAAAPSTRSCGCARTRARSDGGRAVVRALGAEPFVARFGSSFEANPSGGDMLRIPLRGRPRAFPLARGFGLQEPLGLALGPDGALYVSLWTSGRIVRLVPERPAGAASPVLGAAIRALLWLGIALENAF